MSVVISKKVSLVRVFPLNLFVLTYLPHFGITVLKSASGILVPPEISQLIFHLVLSHYVDGASEYYDARCIVMLVCRSWAVGLALSSCLRASIIVHCFAFRMLFTVAQHSGPASLLPMPPVLVRCVSQFPCPELDFCPSHCLLNRSILAQRSAVTEQSLPWTTCFLYCRLHLLDGDSLFYPVGILWCLFEWENIV